MESCFGTIKTELVHQARYETRDACLPYPSAGEPRPGMILANGIVQTGF